MRIILPTLTSQRIAFSQSFHNLNYVYGMNGLVSGSVIVDKGLDVSGGGYVVFGGYGAGMVWNLPYWTISVKAVVPAAGSARSIIACGHSGTDKFEIGIDSSNRMQLIGSSTVVSDDVLTAGSHNLLWIYNGSDVEFWVDGVRIGTETVSLSSNVGNFIYVGVASDGSSRKWGDTINSFSVYTYPMDEEEAFLISGIEGWTPKDLLSDYGGTFGYDNGFYLDGDEDGTYGLNTQPNLLDRECKDASQWIPWLGTLSNIDDYMRVSAPASNTAARQSVLIGGNRYLLDRITARGDGVNGRPYLNHGSMISNTVDAVWTTKYDMEMAPPASNSDFALYTLGLVGANPSHCDFKNLGKLSNRSCKQLNIYGSGTLAGSKFVQATAANMPWKSSDGLGVRFENSPDMAESNATADKFSFLHNGQGGTLFALLNCGNADRGYPFNTSLYSGTNGFSLEKRGDGAGTTPTNLELKVRSSGASAMTLVSSNVVPTGTPSVLIIRVKEGVCSMRLDGVNTAGNLVSPSLSSPDNPMRIGASFATSGVGYVGALRKVGMVDGYLSDAEALRIEDYLMRAAR